jgi:hypothetical protein
MISSASPRLRSRERGEITWVTVVLLLSLATAGYLTVVWAPVYIVRYEVGVVATEYANKAVHNHDDASLVKELCQRLAALDQVKTLQPDGSIALVPAVDLRPEEITWVRDTAVFPPTIHLAFEYTASVYFPILEKFTEKSFAIDRFQDIQPAKW